MRTFTGIDDAPRLKRPPDPRVGPVMHREAAARSAGVFICLPLGTFQLLGVSDRTVLETERFQLFA